MTYSYDRRASTIQWKKEPGRIQDMAKVPGGDVYAKSSDGRFWIFVTRDMRGEHGLRDYTYSFRATDYGLPSGGRKFTSIPLRSTTDPKRVMQEVERWAEAHPVEGPLPV